MTVSYTRRSQGDQDIQPVAIMSVDTDKRIANCMTRTQYILDVECRFAVGEINVIPAVGEQWYIERIDQAWRLKGRIPHMDETLLVEAQEGQVSVGGARGPLELNGTILNARAVMVLFTGTRPDASTVPAGGQMYDENLKKPIYSDGTVWRDALGNTA